MDVLSATDVQAALDALGLGIQVQTFATSTATAQEAADSIGTTLGSIVKSLVFMVDERPLVVLVAGDQKADQRKLAEHLGVGKKKVKIASPDQCIAHVGYAPGGVPPVGHRTPVMVYIDATLGRFETVYAAAGTPNTIFPIGFNTLIEVTGGQVLDVVLATDTNA